MRKFITVAAIAALAAASATVPAAARQTGAGIGSVVNCDASGNRQAYGAALGAVAGMVLGNNVSKGEDAPLVGALAGAAAGSYIGCQQQRTISAREGRGQHVATTNVNVRSGPSTSYPAISRLSPGQPVIVFGYTGNWAHVNMGGDRTGFVSASYLRPTGR